MSVANPIAAAAAAKTPEGQFRAMDVNGDGFISMDEWMAEKKKAKVLYEGSPNCCANCGAWFTKTSFKITDKDIEITSGICAKKIEHVDMWRVDDIAYRSSCTDCLCGTGLISMTTTDKSCPRLVLKGLPDAEALYHAIKDAKQNTREVRIEH